MILLLISDSVSLRSAIEVDLCEGSTRLFIRCELTGIGDQALEVDHLFCLGRVSELLSTVSSSGRL